MEEALLNKDVYSTKRTLILSDGRQIGYLKVGDGKPVIYFHGTASSSLEILLLKDFAFSSKIQIIGIDRPGFGLSSYTPRRNLTDFAKDVDFLIDHLGLKEFGILGWSGGGPFALTYAALFPKKVKRVVVVGAPALPFDVSTAHNMPFARFIMKIPYAGFLAMKRLRSQVLRANADIDAFLESKNGKKMLSGLSKDDEKFFSNRAWLRLMYASMAEAFRQNNDGIKALIQEHQLFMKPWTISFSNLSSEKVFVWQGAEDKTCRIENAYRLVQTIPNANLVVFKGKGHCVMFDNLKKLSTLFCSY